ncbi:MAG: hypothetical protein LUQ26_05295 [Methylococcaceae bacterium]|nr:hypothetical protein [Methylococcaceae bacterium]
MRNKIQVVMLAEEIPLGAKVKRLGRPEVYSLNGSIRYLTPGKTKKILNLTPESGGGMQDVSGSEELIWVTSIGRLLDFNIENQKG